MQSFLEQPRSKKCSTLQSALGPLAYFGHGHPASRIEDLQRRIMMRVPEGSQLTPERQQHLGVGPPGSTPSRQGFFEKLGRECGRSRLEAICSCSEDLRGFV